MRAKARFALGVLVAAVLAVGFGASADAAVVPWNDPTLPFGISTPSGVHYLFGRYSAEVATADGAGGAFVNGVQAVILDAEPVSIGVSGLASDASIAAAGTLLSPEVALGALTAAGIALGAYGLQVLNGQWMISSQNWSNDGTCSDGSLVVLQSPWDSFQSSSMQAIWDDAVAGGHVLAQYNIVNTGFGSGGAFMDLNGVGGYAVPYVGCANSNDSPSSGVTAVPPPASPATTAQVENGIEQGLQASPSAAPTVAQKFSDAGAPPAVSLQVPTGPSSVTGSPTVSTTTSGPAGSTTTTTKTCTPTDNLSYGPGAVSVSQTVSCTTTVTPPAGSASSASSSATTTTTPPSTAASSTSDSFVPPTSSVPTVTPVPPGTIQLPVPSIDNSGGTCPAPLVLDLGLPGIQSMNLDLTPWCNLAAALRPWVLTLAGIVSAVVVVR